MTLQIPLSEEYIIVSQTPINKYTKLKVFTVGTDSSTSSALGLLYRLSLASVAGSHTHIITLTLVTSYVQLTPEINDFVGVHTISMWLYQYIYLYLCMSLVCLMYCCYSFVAMFYC